MVYKSSSLTGSSSGSGGGGAGIVSINSDTTPAQLIVQGAGISVSTIAGTTTITNTSAGSAGVSSVFGRTGVVSANYGDYNFNLISGTSAVSQGGTGRSSLTSHAVLLGEGAVTAVGFATTGNAARLLIDQGNADPAFFPISGDSSMTSTGVMVNLAVHGVTYPSSPSTNTVPVVTSSNVVTYEAVPNAALANSSVTINGVGGTAGGGAVALGASITLGMATNAANTLAGYNGSGVFSDVAIGSNLSLSGGILSGTGGGGGSTSLNAYSLLGNNTNATANGISVQNFFLGTPGFSTSGYTYGQITAITNNFAEFSIQNTNNGANASSDYIVTSDDGNDTTHYIDLGKNNSVSGIAPFTNAHAGYLYDIDNELNIGALGASGTINFYTTGGTSPVSAAQITLTQGLGVASTISGLYTKQPCRLASLIPLTATYVNGNAGVGATLTNSGTQTALVVDGKSAALTNRIMVPLQASNPQNGIYTVTNTGSVSTNWVLTRATDFDGSNFGQIAQGVPIDIFDGSTLAGVFFVQTGAGPFTLGTTPITFVQNSAGALSPGALGGSATQLQYNNTSALGGVATTAVAASGAVSWGSNGTYVGAITSNIGSIAINGIKTPTAPTVVVNSGSGTNLFYYIVAEDAGGNRTSISPASTVASSSATPNNTVSWTAVTNATKYYVLRSAGGTTNGSLTGVVVGTTLAPTVTLNDTVAPGSLTNLVVPPINMTGWLQLGNGSIPVGVYFDDTASNSWGITAGNGEFDILNYSGKGPNLAGAGTTLLKINNVGSVLSNLTSGNFGIGSFGSPDTILARDAAGVWGNRNGINACGFNTYNTFTSTTNYERFGISWASNACTIGTQVGTSGTLRQCIFQAGANVAFTAKATQTVDIMTLQDNNSNLLYSHDKLGRPYTGNTTPTITVGAGAGSGGSPSASISGTDVNGVITVVSGTVIPTSPGTIFIVTFSTPYASAVKTISLTPANQNAAALGAASTVFVDIASISAISFAGKVGSGGITGIGTTFQWYYNTLG